MENNRIQGQGIYYELKDKPFWAAFLNLARNNAQITTYYIYRQIKPDKDELPQITEDNRLWKLNSLSLRQKVRLRDLILRHFPFLKAAAYQKALWKNSEKDKNDKTETDFQKAETEAQSPEILDELLHCFLEKLRVLRNFFSHSEHENEEEILSFNDNFLRYMYEIFDASIRLAQEDYKHNQEIDPLTDFDHLIQREKKGKEKSGFKYDLIDENKKITENGLLFFTSLFLEKKDASWMQKKVRGFKDARTPQKRMTNKVFYRNHILLPKVKLESDPSQAKNWALLDMLNELVRCPKSLYERLHKDDRKKFQVPVDVVEEEETADNPSKNTLTRSQDRFPYFALRFFDANELFDSLRFQIDLGNYHFSIYPQKIGDQLEDRHLTHNLYGFARIQEYDEALQPDHWKAMVKELGYEETSATPYIAKTTPHYHLENEKIGIKFVDNNTDIWPKLKIGKTVNNKDKFLNEKAFTADAFLSVHELMPMLFYYFLLRKDKDKDKKSCAKKIEDYIRQKKGTLFTAYKAFVSGDINNKKELEEYLKDKNILIGHLPKQMVSILSDKPKDMEEAAKKKIKFMKDDTQKRLKCIEKYFSQEDETEEKNHGVLKVGKIASWLVKDFMRFQPIDMSQPEMQRGNTKANSTEYQLLQRSLALFSSEKDRLGRYLNQTRLTGSKNPHPFLDKIYKKNHSNLLSFYRSYLNERNNFLNNIQPKDWEKYQHILRLKTPKHDREKLVEGWKNGFCLPRGIFTEKIKEWFEKHKPDIKICDYSRETWRVGFVPKAISLYFQEVCEDNVQPFYSCPFNVGNPQKPQNGRYEDTDQRAKLWKINKERSKDFPDEIKKITNKIYAIFLEVNKNNYNNQANILKKEISNLALLESYEEKIDSIKKEQAKNRKDEPFNSLQEDLLKSAESLPSKFKAWQKFERELRQIKNQDRLTWMMCEELWERKDAKDAETPKLYLKELDTDAASEKRLNALNVVKPMTLKVNIYQANQWGYVNKKQTPIKCVCIKEEKTKLLKQGNFKALVKDRRLNGLLSFVNDEGVEEEMRFISKIRVEHELSKYQHARIELFQLMHHLESKLFEKGYRSPDNKFRTLLNNWLEKQDNREELEDYVTCLTVIRNAIAHNQYPMYDGKIFKEAEQFCLKETPQTPEKEGMGITTHLVTKTKEAIKKIKETENVT